MASFALICLICLACLASSASALLLPLARTHAALRPAMQPCRLPAVLAAEATAEAEDALAKATAAEAKAVSELADAIAADESTIGCIVDAENAEDVDACVNQGIVWSLEESGDGWDDVRAAVIEAKKERVKALDTIKEKYGPGVSAAAKWAKVIAGEVGGALPTEGIKLDKGIKLDIKAPEGKSVKEVAKNAVFSLLDAAAERKRAEKAKQQQLADKLQAEEKARKRNFFRKE